MAAGPRPRRWCSLTRAGVPQQQEQHPKAGQASGRSCGLWEPGQRGRPRGPLSPGGSARGGNPRPPQTVPSSCVIDAGNAAGAEQPGWGHRPAARSPRGAEGAERAPPPAAAPAQAAAPPAGPGARQAAVPGAAASRIRAGGSSAASSVRRSGGPAARCASRAAARPTALASGRAGCCPAACRPVGCSGWQCHRDAADSRASVTWCVTGAVAAQTAVK